MRRRARREHQHQTVGTTEGIPVALVAALGNRVGQRPAPLPRRPRLPVRIDVRPVEPSDAGSRITSVGAMAGARDITFPGCAFFTSASFPFYFAPATTGGFIVASFA
jgi:hypothetical protein